MTSIGLHVSSRAQTPNVTRSIAFCLLVTTCAILWAAMNTDLDSKSLSSNMNYEPETSLLSVDTRNISFPNDLGVFQYTAINIDSGDHAWIIGILIVLLGLAAYWTVKRAFPEQYTRDSAERIAPGVFAIPKLTYLYNARAAKYLWNRLLRKTGVALPLMAAFIVAWITIGTIIVSIVAKWPAAQSFFYVVNTGFQRDFICAYPGGPNSSAGTVVTFANKLLGAILFSTSLVLFLNAMIIEIRGDARAAVLLRCSEDEALRACLAGVRTRGPFKTVAIDTSHTGVANGIGIDTTGDCCIDTVVVKPPAVFFTPDRVYLGTAAVVWHVLGVIYGLVFEGWDLPSAISFAVTTLSIGGAMQLTEDPQTGLLPELHAWLLGLWIAVSVDGAENGRSERARDEGKLGLGSRDGRLSERASRDGQGEGCVEEARVLRQSNWVRLAKEGGSEGARKGEGGRGRGGEGREREGGEEGRARGKKRSAGPDGFGRRSRGRPGAQLGVPLFASTVASYSSFLVEANMRDHDRRALDEPISMEDYEVLAPAPPPCHPLPSPSPPSSPRLHRGYAARQRGRYAGRKRAFLAATAGRASTPLRARSAARGGLVTPAAALSGGRVCGRWGARCAGVCVCARACRLRGGS